MQASSARAYKALASKIHQQLQVPLSARESQQLLALLTSSFRRHLERCFPRRLDDGDRGSRVHFRPPAARPQPRREAPSSYSSVDAHLLSILDSPLFAASRGSPLGAAAPDLRRARAKSVAIFNSRVALGTATLADALNCLRSIDRLFSDAPRSPGEHRHGLGAIHGSGGGFRYADFEQFVRETRPGSTILKWLSWNTAAASEALTDRAFTWKLAKFLVAEGCQPMLWKWVGRGGTGILAVPDPSPDQTTEWTHRIVFAMMHAELHDKGNVDAAIEVFLHALSLQAPEIDTGKLVLYNPATWLMRNLTCSPVRASSSVFDQLGPLARFWTRYPDLDRALLATVHPTQPCAEPGLTVLKRSAIANRPTSKLNPSQRWRLMQLCLNVAHLLDGEGRHSDAIWVMDFARKKFPVETGLQKPAENVSEKQENESLPSLDSLLLPT